MDNTIQQQTIERKRGILLTTWLILIFVASLIAVLNFFFDIDKSAPYSPANNQNVPFWVIYATGLGSLAYTTSAIFIFFWKRWAIYAFGIIALILFIVNILSNSQETIGQNPFVGALGTIILILLCLPKWKMFQ